MSEKAISHRRLASLRNFTIGFADGLTVPFALTAGLSSLGSSKLVIVGGLAELFSGSISMGLGAYLAATTKGNCETVETILNRYGVSPSTCAKVSEEVDAQFVKDFEGEQSQPWLAALVMGLAYFIGTSFQFVLSKDATDMDSGGLIPMIPYFALDVTRALFVSIAITVVILVIFGGVKDYYTVGGKGNAVKGAIKTLAVGVIAAGASYGIVRAIDQANI